MLDYIIKVLLFQTLFLAVYDLLLKKETFFQWNRIYLILTSLLANIIPLVRFESVQKIIPQEYVVLLPEVILSPTTIIEQKVEQSSLLFTSLQWVFWLGVAITSLLFLLKLTKIINLIISNRKIHNSNYWLILLENNNAFSFFSYIFLGKSITDERKDQIIEHELVHVQQKHSVDLLIFEIQKIMFWFNPFSYIYQHRISELHEFIADSKAVKGIDKTTYFNNLLAETFGVQHISFINPFFKHSLIKKRILMLHKNRSKQFLKLKYLLLIPVLASMLVYTSCERSETKLLNKNEKRLISLHFGTKGKTEVKVTKSDKEGYFDMYLGDAPEGKEISYSDLTDDEKKEYDTTKNILKNENAKFQTYKIYEMSDGKRALLQIIDWKGMKKSWASKDYSNAEVVPFASIDQAPIFPDCEDDQDPKACFENKIKEHVTQNFDITISNGLDIDSEYKKIYVQFTINQNGTITETRARGPHEALEEEALRVIKTLPQMQPGEENGNKVSVKYTLPITFKVD